jgi:hypothetical protein
MNGYRPEELWRVEGRRGGGPTAGASVSVPRRFRHTLEPGSDPSFGCPADRGGAFSAGRPWQVLPEPSQEELRLCVQRSTANRLHCVPAYRQCDEAVASFVTVQCAANKSAPASPARVPAKRYLPFTRHESAAFVPTFSRPRRRRPGLRRVRLRARAPLPDPCAEEPPRAPQLPRQRRRRRRTPGGSRR